jgi:hypothetical protein
MTIIFQRDDGIGNSARGKMPDNGRDVEAIFYTVLSIALANLGKDYEHRKRVSAHQLSNYR